MNSESQTDWQRIDALTDDDIAAGISADPDAAPVASRADFAHARHSTEAVPQVVELYRRGRGPQKTPTKVPVSLRLSPEVIEYFKAQGKGWQSRLDDVLQEYVASHAG